MGLTHNFHGKKGPEILGGLKGGGQKQFCNFFFASASPPPYKCLWTIPYKLDNKSFGKINLNSLL